MTNWWMGPTLFLSGVVAGGLVGFGIAALCLRFAMLRTLARMREMMRRTCDYAANAATVRQAEMQENPKRRDMWTN